MNAYTLYDAYAFLDIPKSVFNGVNQNRITFRVKNPDQQALRPVG